jgi:hypothetical protein
MQASDKDQASVMGIMEEYGWNWIGKLFHLVPISFPITAIILSCILYILYLYSILRIDYVSEQMDIHDRIIIIETFILIAYLMIGTQHYINTIKGLFIKARIFSGKSEGYCNELDEEIFSNSRYFFILLLLNFSVSLILDIFQNDFYYSIEPTQWSALVDILNLLINLLFIYLSTMITWIIINISIGLSRVQRHFHKGIVDIRLFSSDRMGGLKPIRNLAISVVVYLFIAVSLGIINFVTPGGTFWKEITYFLMLFAFGVILFLRAWLVIDDILESKRESEIDLINEMYEKLMQQIASITYEGDGEKDKERLDQALETSKWLREEWERVMTAGGEAFNIRTILVFIGSSLFPLLTLYEKVSELGLLNRVMELLHL